MDRATRPPARPPARPVRLPKGLRTPSITTLVSGGGPTAGLGGGPTEDYIREPGPHFWALSSSAQSYLQEMRVRRVLMSESAEIPKGILFEVKLEILGLDLNVSHYFEVLNVSVF
jgi:hypothetical protein